ncbi:MAG: hypothetical protein M1299_07195 [Firmicutes bacterium]|nr:hypothetical protein [Bacillota bacterium]
MKSQGFFPMPKREAGKLLILLMLAAILFLPWFRNTNFNGISLFGWGMGLYMLVAPAIGLWNLEKGDKKMS